MTIAVIINSFNRLSLLQSAVKAIQSWYTPSFPYKIKFVVFDAGSSDGSIAWCKEVRASGVSLDLIIPVEGEDTSFAAGLNAGVNYAVANFQDLTYLLFYETDNCIDSAQPLQNAVAVLEKLPSLGACGFTVKKYDGTNAGAGMPFPTLFNFLVGKNIVHKFQLESIPYKWQKIAGTRFSFVDIVFTSPLLVKVKSWQDSGGLDAVKFPFSDCDIDWAKRLRLKGWRMGVIETGSVFHDNKQLISTWSKTRTLAYHRARLKYFKQYHPLSVYLIWPLMLSFRHLAEYAASFFLKNKEKRKVMKGKFMQLTWKCFTNYE